MVELKDGRVKSRLEEYNRTAERKIEITGRQAAPVGLYGYYQRRGNVLKFSGFGSRDENNNAINGRIGEEEGERSLAYGQEAARGACLNFINNLAVACHGDLDAVKHVAIRVDINSSPAFKKLPDVANGASQLLLEVFGKYVGRPERTAAGSSSLPNDMSVEITGEVIITDQLAAHLDLLDMQRLAATLTAVNSMIGPVPRSETHKAVVSRLRNATSFTEDDKEMLEQYTDRLLSKLGAMSDEEVNGKLAENSHAALEGAVSRQDLIDKISYEAQEAHLAVGAGREYAKDKPALHR